MMKLIKRFKYIFDKENKKKVVLLLLLSFIGSLLELLGVSAILPMVTLIMNAEEYADNRILQYMYTKLKFNDISKMILLIIIVIVFIYIIKNIYLIWVNKKLYSFIYKSQEKLARKMLRTYMEEPYLFHLSKNTAELQRSINNDVIFFYIVVLHLLQLAVEVLVCVVLGLYLLKTSVLITLGVLILVMVCVGSFYTLTKKTSKVIGIQNQIDNGKMLQWVNQSLGGIKEVKLLQREKFFENQYAVYYRRFAEGTLKYNMIQVMPKYIIEASCISGLLLTVAFQLMNGVDTMKLIPQITVFAVAAFRLLPSVSKISSHISTIIFYRPSVELVYNDLKEIENVKSQEKKMILKELDFNKSIQVKDISFSYPNASEYVLDRVNLQINKGESIAFIGPSGAGKTTLVDLILGLMEPQKGEILVDNVDIKNNLSNWYQKIGYIPQNIFLMDDTILNNIAFAVDKEDIDMNKVQKAIKQAQIEDFINNLENGLFTEIGERGVRLSGGQRQRIGIARALYKEPDILIMDEATSALDSETELAVMEAIDNLRGLKTMIIIAHRLSTITKCDYIYEVKDKTVVQVNKLGIENKSKKKSDKCDL